MAFGGKVAVLMGGSSEHTELSIYVGEQVLKALHEEGVDAVGFDPARRCVSELKQNYQTVFHVLFGRGGEDGTILGWLEVAGIPYTGSGVLGTAISNDKVMSKYVWIGHGLPTPRHTVINKARYTDADAVKIVAELGLPVMVKPSREDGSAGTAMAENLDDLRKAIQEAFRFGETILLETFLTGREFTVTILNNKPLPPIEVKMAAGQKYYSNEAKADHSLREFICPRDLSKEQITELGELAKNAFLSLGCSQYGRVDIRMDSQGKLYLLEVNSTSVLTPESSMTKAAEAAGLTFNELVLEILKGASLKLN